MDVSFLPSRRSTMEKLGSAISFDFAAIPSLNKMQVLELACCEWIDRCDNVIALGLSCTGKTHAALGLAACQKRPALPPPPPSFMNSWTPVTSASSCASRSSYSLSSLV